LLFGRDVLPKILCIDDEEDLRQDIVEELQDAGYEVLEASNGKEGLQAILDDEPDLVVSDITMPVMDGYELISTLRTNHTKYDEMPFIFLSALADKENVLKGMKTGSDDYITKPIDFDILLAKVETRLRQAGRMIERKKKEHLLLYKAMKKRQDNNSAQEPAQTPPPVAKNFVFVGKQGTMQSEFKNLLEMEGNKVTTFTSGRTYLTKRKQISADIYFFWLKTDDFDFPKIYSRLNAQENKVVYVTEPSDRKFTKFLLSKIDLTELTGVLKLPSEHGVIHNHLSEWMKD
jgi:DNA-binding response OmpR family regulator